MILLIINIIRIVANVICLLILARALLSWISMYYRNDTVYQMYRLTYRLTEPLAAPCRSLLSKYNTGMFDFSLLLLYLIVRVIARLSIYILAGYIPFIGRIF